MSHLQPSRLWCMRQTIRGTHGSHLTIPDADLRGLWIIITGANSGIGYQSALQFAKWGANVILACRPTCPPTEQHPDDACRRVSGAARAAGHRDSEIEQWNLDMADLSSVEAFAQRWLDTGRPLDRLINNAGMGGTTGRKIVTKDGFGIVHQVNFLSHVLLTMSLIPALAKAEWPRITCTTSCMHYLGKFDVALANESWGSYPNNKLFFQTWLTEFQSRVLNNDELKRITIHGVHPGYVQTGIWTSTKTVDPNRSMDAVERLLNYFLNSVGIDAQQGSLTITHAATAPECGPDPLTQNADGAAGKGGGRYFNRIFEAEPMPQTKDPECRQQIWKLVVDELKLEDRGLLHPFSE